MLHTKQTNYTKQSHVLYHNSYYNTNQIRMLLTDITHCKSPACPSLFQCCHMDVVLVAFASIFRCSVSPPSSNCITLSQPALYLSIHCLDAFHTPFCVRKPAYTGYSQHILYFTRTMYSYVHPPFVSIRQCNSSYCKTINKCYRQFCMRNIYTWQYIIDHILLSHSLVEYHSDIMVM